MYDHHRQDRDHSTGLDHCSRNIKPICEGTSHVQQTRSSRKNLIGHRALVTGGSRGIGATLAQALFLDAGGQGRGSLAAYAQRRHSPAAATFVSGDVTTSEGVEGIATKGARGRSADSTFS